MQTLLAFALMSLVSTTPPTYGVGNSCDLTALEVQPPDYIAAVLAPGAFPASFPAGINQFYEPAIQSGLMLAGKLRDADGNVVGFAVEQAEADFQALVSTATWTLTLPGRGSLFLAQQEDLTLLVQILTDMMMNQEYERTYDPPLYVVTTIGEGIVVGGTGEFAGARGTFREVDFVEYLNLVTGELHVVDRFEFDIKCQHGE